MTIGKTYSLAAIGAHAVSETLIADAAERDEIARRFAFLAVPELSADVGLSARGAGAILKARIRGEIIQQCGVTLKEVPETIDFEISVTFVPEAEFEEEQHVTDTETEIEVFEGDALDVGETLIQLFAMAADPYPRHPDADTEQMALAEGSKQGKKPGDRADEDRESPFAVLGALRKNT